MKRPVLVFVILIAGASGWLAWMLAPLDDPVCSGKPLSYWLAQPFDYEAKNQPVPYISFRDVQIEDERLLKPEVFAAVREAGARAVPRLLRMAGARDSALKLKLIELWQRQSVVPVHFVSAKRKYLGALEGFRALGPKASNAVPELARICAADYPEESRLCSLEDLAFIGPPASNAVSAVLRVAEQATNSDERVYAIHALGQIQARPELVVPALIRLLDDRDLPVRVQAAADLADFGTNAAAAMPRLRRLAAAGGFDKAAPSLPPYDNRTNLAYWAWVGLQGITSTAGAGRR